MRCALGLALAAAAMSPWASAEEPLPDGNPAVELPDDASKASYCLGLNIGRNLKSQGVPVDPTIFARGLADALSGAQPALTDEEVAAVMQAFEKEMAARHRARSMRAGQANLAEGEQFLAANAKKEGVKTLPSGLQYKVLKVGNGPKPQARDTVRTHYEGRLINGEVFDSSYAREEPTTFEVGGVIPGWTEALKLMPVGSKWQLFIPAKLAYGERGAGPQIGPNATLVFDIELLAIE